MNVLITGGTGFLGQHVAVRLSQLGHTVAVLGRNAQMGSEMAAQGFEFHKVDITDKSALLQVSTGQDAVIHCAGLAAPHGPYDRFYQANVVGTRNVVRACMQNKVKRLVNISSPGVYFTARDRLNIKESDPLPEIQLTPYAATKLMAELVIDKAVAQGLSAITLRPRAIFGPGDNIYFPALVEKAVCGFFPVIDGGCALLDMTYIDNAVDAVILAMEADPRLSGEKYNITNDQPIMFREMVQKLFRSLQKEIRIINLPYALVFNVGAALEFLYRFLPTDEKPFITRYSVGLVGTSQTHDIAKAKAQLGYVPKVSIDEGFRRFAQTWQELPGPK